MAHAASHTDHGPRPEADSPHPPARAARIPPGVCDRIPPGVCDRIPPGVCATDHGPRPTRDASRAKVSRPRAEGRGRVQKLNERSIKTALEAAHARAYAARYRPVWPVARYGPA
jgi:hypothetical protein